MVGKWRSKNVTEKRRRAVFEVLYETRDDDTEPFGEHWCGPQQFKPWEETLIAVYASPDTSDGQSVEVYLTAAPARFWTIRVLDDRDSAGESLDRFDITTGSGGREMAQFVHKTAELIADGMLGFSAPTKELHRET